MFEHLGKFDKILVTGPQRSGTHACAKMIAQDLGYEYVDEAEISVSDKGKAEALCRERMGFVLQCPSLSWCIDGFGDDNTLIVFMYRDWSDIHASAERIGWLGAQPEHRETARYAQTNWYADQVATGNHQRPYYELTYDYWETEQRHRVKHFLEVQYESLSGHPLWVSKRLRTDWAANQTKVREE